MEQQQPPPQPRKLCTGAWMSVRSGQWSGSLPPLPPTYPTIPEDPQTGGPSNPTPIVELPQPPPTAYDPYLQAVIQNALYPPPFPLTYQNPGYPNPGYPYPVFPQPQPSQQQLPIEAINQVLERAEQIQQQAEKNEQRMSKIFKKLSKIVKGRRDD
ncbi:leucine-rich repeat extensin-like protein 5 [Helianthus annuus]|uniref:leucine-rich repeat extensin-like protein 5 n=1 Tax=Helianthus annuus TaxID=4232 RepID=UPI000B8F35C0|nr:leucine-rich repeat extensin-like protein 5 [Helianthus annuus]